MRKFTKTLLPVLCVVALLTCTFGSFGVLSASAAGIPAAEKAQSILDKYDVDTMNGMKQVGVANDGIVTAWDILKVDGYIEGVWIPWLTHSWLGSSLAANDLENYDSFLGHDKYGEIEDEMIVIREYVKLYDRSPQMPFPSIKDYRMFGEMGDVVFGAKYSDSFGFTFSSWYQDREHLSVTLGNYSGDYESSKEAFATRARLVDIHKLFTEDEAANLYRCIDYVRVHSEGLTFEQDEQLRDLTDKLTDGYPKLRDNPPSCDEDTTIKMDM